MPIAEALALGRKLPGWHQQDHDRAADRRALTRLARWCHRFSPTVGLEDAQTLTPPWPETLLLDATNVARLFGGETVFVQQVAQGLARLGLEGRLALADNVATAWAVAHYGDLHSGDAKPENDPRNVAAVIPPGTGQRVLDTLPVAALRLPPPVEQTLHRLGIADIGSLLALPRDQLRSRFGEVLLKRMGQALGSLTEVIEAVPAPPEFAVREQLEHPLAKREHVEEIVKQLIERLARLLVIHDTGALQLRCRFECQSTQTVKVEVGLFRPSANAAHLLEIAQMHLERLLLPGPVTAVEVRVARYGPLERRQQVLFQSENNSLTSSAQLAALIDRLAGRLGRAAVIRCQLRHDAQPELAYRQQPLVDAGKLSVHSKATSRRAMPRSHAAENFRQENLGPLDRPLQLLERPARIDVFAVKARDQSHHDQSDQNQADQESDSPRPPEQFYYRNRRHEVVRHWGPERIETGWWRQRSVSRDYYRVETIPGERFWIYYCLKSQRWFLQGVFG